MIQPYKYSLPIPQNVEQKVKNNLIYYGKDNVQPQIVRQVVGNCGIGKAATDLYSTFLIGDGFVNPELNDIEINESGDTLYDLLRFVAESVSLFDGFSLHFDYNTLLEISDISFIDLDFVRLGNPYDPKVADKALVWDNWAGEGLVRNTPILMFDKFNLKDTDKERYNKFDSFDNFKGEIFYYGSKCNKSRVYPSAPSDPVLQDMMTWKSISVFRYKSANNNFVASKIIEMLGTQESPHASQEMADTLRRTLGAENAGNLMVIPGGYRDEDGRLQSAFEVHDVNITTYDNLFIQSTMQVENNILRAYNIPSLLMSVDNRNSLNTSTGALKEAYTIYNNFTSDKRKEITSIFNKILTKHMNIPEGTTFEILPKKFLDFN